MAHGYSPRIFQRKYSLSVDALLIGRLCSSQVQQGSQGHPLQCQPLLYIRHIDLLGREPSSPSISIFLLALSGTSRPWVVSPRPPPLALPLLPPVGIRFISGACCGQPLNFRVCGLYESPQMGFMVPPQPPSVPLFLLLYQLFKRRRGSSGPKKPLPWPTPQTPSPLPHPQVFGETSLNFLIGLLASVVP